jgi:putative pyoverdin transport system ATP-binding/permease protein
MKLLLLLLNRSRGTVALAIVAGALGGIGSAGLIALVQEALQSPQSARTGLIGAFAGLCLLVLLAKIISQAFLIRLSQTAVYELYLRLSRTVLAAPLRALEEFGPHRVLALLTEDVRIIAHALLGLPVVAINLAILICCLGYIGWLSPIVLAAVVVFLITGATSYHLVVMRAMRYLLRARDEQDDLMKQFRGLTDGSKELKLHEPRRTGFFDQLLEPSCARFRADTTAGMTLYAAAGAWGQLLFFVAIGLIVFALPRWFDLSQPVLAGAVLTTLFAASPLEAIMGWLPAFGQARISFAKVEQLSRMPAEIAAAPLAPSSEAIVELIGITHSYRREGEESGFALGPIDIALYPGQITFLIGGNGSGKTTLAKVLVGLYAPEGGAIRLNGKLVADEDRESYRQHFSAVFGDFYLFERLVGLGRPELDAEASDYLRHLRLDYKVQVRDGAFTTTALSQGQRKRLALLAAYLEDRPVYLFDEWAADQDPLFKRVFYTQLLPELRARGKAVLVISHDDRYFSVADRLVRLDYGRLAAADSDHVSFTVA